MSNSDRDIIALIPAIWPIGETAVTVLYIFPVGKIALHQAPCIADPVVKSEYIYIGIKSHQRNDAA